MTASPSPYDVLGVAPSATQAQIRAAYRAGLRARTHSRESLTQAFSQLQSAANRLAADLVEPPWSGVDALRDASATVPRPSPVDDAVAPLPRLRDLVVPGVDPAVTPHRDVGPVTEPFRSRAVRPTAAVLPPIEIEV
jgi:hypothetical protein